MTGDAQDEILHKLALDLNENLPEIYLWQPNYLHVYSDKLGGGFAIYPERARVVPEDPRLDLHPVDSRRDRDRVMRAPTGRLLFIA